jgi:hypothetical protein
MDEDRSANDAGPRPERTADELDDRLDRLGGHIDDAKAKARERREEVDASRVVAGDWHEERPAPAGGDDPEGAVGGEDSR